MRKLKKLLKWAVVMGLVLVVALSAVLVYLARTRQPELDGKVTHPSLRGEVRVVRDDYGVPHIEAAHEADAYFALGYVMAQDRLFQMELLLRLARGELAELLGPPAASIDGLIRCFSLKDKAEAAYAARDVLSPEALEMVDAFVAGMNHCVETQPLPFEFAILRIPPRTFTPPDCLTVAAILPIAFADGMRCDPVMSMLKEKLPDMDVEALFSGYDDEVPITIMESLEEAETYLKEKAQAAQDSVAQAKPDESVAGLTALLAPLQVIRDLFGPALGSNSWVLGPSKTKSGQSIHANDPHIPFLNPSIWYEAHLKCDNHEIYGHYMPLIPFPLLGHNRQHAWGLTMFANDDIDMYRETFKPDDPTKVMYKGQWTDVETRTTPIKVRFGSDQTCTIRVTPHGPVVTDLLRLMLGYEGADVSLSWVWQHLAYTDAQAFYEMSRATDYASFEKAVALVTSPGINVSYADRDGNIAWWAAGVIPIRPKHVNPKELLDGASGNDEILGYVPFEQNPHLKNPACGYIVTANNKSTVKPVGPVDDIEGYWQPGDRAGRIEQILESKDKWSIEELKAVQFDDTAYAAPAIVKSITEILDKQQAQLDAFERHALETLKKWDYRHNLESRGATIYQELTHVIIGNVFEDEMGEELFRGYCSVADHWNYFKYIIHRDDCPFWDNIATQAKETRTDIVTQSFKQSVAQLKEKMGGKVDDWAWGAIHTMEFKHPFGYLPLLGKIFNVGPFPSSGGGEVVNNMMNGPNYDVLAGPSTRRLIDFADPEHALVVTPPGNSGNFMSPHYGDQAAMFMAGDYREPNITPEQIEQHKEHVLTFSAR